MARACSFAMPLSNAHLYSFLIFLSGAASSIILDIDKSMISQITEPYFTTKIGGTGLGLAITKKIIDDHNGTILIKSSKISEGTSILLKFPLISRNNNE